MNIVVCGGGTAGWIAAYMLVTAHPGKHNVTVIESTEIGIVGAGEGSTGALTNVIKGYYMKPPSDEKTFMSKTNATYKYGINHVNWGKEKGSYFAPLDGSFTKQLSPNLGFNHVVATYGGKKAYLSSEIGQAYELGKMGATNYSYHFDAFKVGAYFKECLEDNPNITHIDSKILDVIVSSSGNIEKLYLEDEKEVSGDFFIDCTGFSRLLMTKLGVGWHSYKKYLPVDRGMPFLLDYENDQVDIKPMTTAHALSAGWMWQIPLQNRMGCGYVYNSDFISEEGAQAEIEKLLKRKITPIRHLKFESGRLESLWKNNCMATGLAGAFNEPLEATSIHSTIYQITTFIFNHLTDSVETTLTEENIQGYNREMRDLYDGYRDFLNVHYQGGRDDTEFWRHMNSEETQTDFVKEILVRVKNKIPTSFNFESDSYSFLWNWVLAGLGLITPELAKKELEMFNMEEDAKHRYDTFSNGITGFIESRRSSIPDFTLRANHLTYHGPDKTFY